MILHIFTDSPYTYRYIDFVNKMWEPRIHEFIVSAKKNSRFKDYYQNTKNCHMVSEKGRGFLLYASLFVKAQKVIFHQLNQPRLFMALILIYPSIFRKSVWSIWGGDVYFHRYKTNSLKDDLIEKTVEHVISKLPFVTGYIPGDFEVVMSRYKSNAKYIKSKYPSPIDIEGVKAFKAEKKQDASKTIMVGNSADPSNEHIDAFSQLSRYKDKNIKVLSVLSYGGNDEYISRVITSGKDIFGDKFVPIIDFMSFDEYLNFISVVDICYFNHRRQQGLGNVILCLALGKKVFISHDVTAYDYYRSIGISLFPTEEVMNMTFDEFVQFDTYACAIERNKAIIFEDQDLANIRSEWEDVFNA